ncbi:DUF2812 domain-containing protein [Terrisporobacter sp.]
MVILKFFVLGEYEKKQEWINKMCIKGYALIKCNMFSFTFDKCNPGEYYYSLELLENLSSSPSNEDFINYLKDEWSIEYVCQYRNWAYFRRKRKLGEFSLFSSASSKVYYFKRILISRLILILFLIIFSILNILSSDKGSIDQVFAFLLILISIVAIMLNIPTLTKYRKLKKLDES